MKNRTLRFACGLMLACLCVLTGTCGAFAQIMEATLQGRVLNSEERALVAASVSARNDATGLIRTATTGDDGGFTLASLPPGTYTVGARADGFKIFEQRSLARGVRRRHADAARGVGASLAAARRVSPVASAERHDGWPRSHRFE